MTHIVRPIDRAYAASSLLFGSVALVLALDFLTDRFPRGLLLLVFVLAATALCWYGLVGTGASRVGGFAGSAIAVAAAFILLADGEFRFFQLLAIFVSQILAVVTARKAFSIKVPLPEAVAPEHPVLFYNPKSGGGKAEKFSLSEEARSRGYRAVELTAGDDLEELVRRAVDEGADGLAMAGGDGSQAVVAMVASELDLPYACIPAGTRNHFALDLGVDREDVVGALDAFVDAGERRVDLAEVNGQVFVNNVSLGFYAEAVQRRGYREAKLRTMLETLPEFVGRDAEGNSLTWTSPSGRRHSSGAAILVSNNKYRLGKAVGSGTRPKIDDGLLGIAVLADPTSVGSRMRSFQKPWRDWSTPHFEVGSDEPVPAGIDGESVQLDPPLDFRIRPAALRVRIARNHPGASPSAAIPEGIIKVARSLARIVIGRPPNENAVTRKPEREQDRDE